MVNLRRVVLLVATLSAACAKPYLDVRKDAPPFPPTPDGVTHQVETFAGVDGIELFAQSWRPAAGEPRGVLVVQHGLRDAGDHYAPFAAALVARGYAVYAMDLPGHARSAGRRVTVGAFDDYVVDLEKFVASVAAREPGKPLFLFGHSMGGAIVIRYAERHPELVGLITSAPAIRIDLPPFGAAALLVAGTLMPNFGQLAPTNDDFSTDPAVEADMARDPLIFQPGGPAATGKELVGGIEQVWANVNHLTMPMLLLHGTGDHLTAPAGSRELFERAASKDKTLRLYPNLAHDLVHEPGGLVVPDVIAWLDAHTGGAAPSFAATDLTQKLRGDGAKPTISLALEGDYARGGGENFGGGALRARVLLGGTVAFALGLDASAAGGGAGLYRAVLSPIGLGIQGAGDTLSVGFGAGVSNAPGLGAGFEAALAVDGELQLGAVRLLGWGRFSWIPGNETRRLGAGVSDELHAGLAIRLGANHRYWSTANAGAGPYLGATIDRELDTTFVGVALGLHMWGGTR
jgi:alpha-beta hydrolase superfamily lysophospholipase